MRKVIRHASNKKVRVGTAWRRPRGLQNKMRLGKKGFRLRLKEGFMSPKATRGLKNGLQIVTVYTEKDLAAVNPKTQGVILGNTGIKKKLALLQIIIDKKIPFHMGDAAKYKAVLEKSYNEGKLSHKQKMKEKQAKRTELEKKAKKEEKKSLEEEVDAEEKQEQQKKAEETEKAKTLTKAQ